jgi:hypothetical protein
MKLYNVTFDSKDRRKIIAPSIPNATCDGENKTIKRVCLADSIEHCMQAVSNTRNMRNGAIVFVREVDTKDLDSKKLIKPKVLRERGLVPDALVNNEYWYLDKVEFRCAECEIIKFDVEAAFAWSCIDIKDLQEIVKKVLPKFPAGRYTIAEHLFEAALHYADSLKLYDTEDYIYDNLADLPLAQCLKINSVKLKKIGA